MEATRSGWFECSCCPTNIVRLIPSIPGYMYAQKADSLYINLFISSVAEISLHQKQVQVVQQNNYPWEGALSFTINPAAPDPFTILIRIPGWAQNKAISSDLYYFRNNSDNKPVIKLNGEEIGYTITNGYAAIHRTWKKNDRVELNLPMEIRKVSANEKVSDDRGRMALQRGPLIYCAEWVDNHGKTSNIILPENTSFTSEFLPGLLNGVTVLKTEVPAVIIQHDSVSTVKQSFTAIPYYGWANRGKGEMMIWFPILVKVVDLLTN